MSLPKVAFFDIDGTLIDSNPEIYAQAQAPDAPKELVESVFLPTPAVQRALRRFVEAGNLAFLCSGRPPEGLSMLLDALPFAGYIALAGSYVQLGDTPLLASEGLFERLVPALEAFEACDVAALFEGPRGSAVYLPSPHHELPAMNIEVIEDAQELKERGDELTLVKAFWMAEEDKRLGPVRDELNRLYRISDLGVGGSELTLPEFSKGSAIKVMLDAIGPHETVYGFGDSENDISMLEAAEVAVVMDNATDAIKAYGDVIAPGVSQDGVAQVLDAIMQGNKMPHLD